MVYSGKKRCILWVLRPPAAGERVVSLTGKIDLSSLLPEELEALMSDLGEPKYRAAQVFTWLYRHGATDLSEMTNLPKNLRQKLSTAAWITHLPVLAKRETGDGETTKFLFGLPDGHAVETVLMRYRYGNSICVSTQVGCRMSCSFCASTLGGLVRNLTPGEIAAQVLQLRRECLPEDLGQPSLVLMGTGEPLDNYENVLKFLRLINEPAGINISYRKIALSTSGLVPEIRQLAVAALPITLSVSLHAPNDTLRDRLMPINRRYPLRELMPACREYSEQTGRRITYEYALIDGVNDTLGCARELAQLLHGTLSHVNLIPLNPVAEREYRRSPAAAVTLFHQSLVQQGINATVRRELGTDIDAACGQLRRQFDQKREAGGEPVEPQRVH